MTGSPFDLQSPEAYAAWRHHKLAVPPPTEATLLVKIKDPRALTATEHTALSARIRQWNMALYAGTTLEADPGIPRQLGAQFGLNHLDANWLADEDGISKISVQEGDTREAYIPYTNRPLKWHTDGYYNPQDRLIRGMLLHCVHNAQTGGDNRLMDHEMAYLLLRDQNPEFIRALMQPDAMVIPERVDEVDGIRPQQGGAVFSVDDASGRLHMRYTARTRSIAWNKDETTRAAVVALETLLAQPSPHIVRTRLTPGMGLLCNNVLHDRSGFIDDPQRPRLLYRARYLDSITG
ncbi:MAG: TauD/TfdA family dioxygenase [Ferrovum sp.]|nr:TauD/TfdA family dioxygenase [Ferrovum sp.]